MVAIGYHHNNAVKSILLPNDFLLGVALLCQTSSPKFMLKSWEVLGTRLFNYYNRCSVQGMCSIELFRLVKICGRGGGGGGGGGVGAMSY